MPRALCDTADFALHEFGGKGAIGVAEAVGDRVIEATGLGDSVGLGEGVSSTAKTGAESASTNEAATAETATAETEMDRVKIDIYLKVALGFTRE